MGLASDWLAGLDSRNASKLLVCTSKLDLAYVFLNQARLSLVNLAIAE